MRSKRSASCCTLFFFFFLLQQSCRTAGRNGQWIAVWWICQFTWWGLLARPTENFRIVHGVTVMLARRTAPAHIRVHHRHINGHPLTLLLGMAYHGSGAVPGTHRRRSGSAVLLVAVVCSNLFKAREASMHSRELFLVQNCKGCTAQAVVHSRCD